MEYRGLGRTGVTRRCMRLTILFAPGRCAMIGTSAFGARQLVESLWGTKEYGLNRFISEQPPYNLLDRRIERELVPMARPAVLRFSPSRRLRVAS